MRPQKQYQMNEGKKMLHVAKYLGWCGTGQDGYSYFGAVHLYSAVGEVQIKNVKKVVEYSDLYIMNSWKM